MKHISFSDTISKLQWGIFIAVMLFAACERSEYTTRITPIGHALTDRIGRFGFLDWNVDFNTYDPRYESKFHVDYGNFIIVHLTDTLFCGQYSGWYKELILYPGNNHIPHYYD